MRFDERQGNHRHFLRWFSLFLILFLLLGHLTTASAFEAVDPSRNVQLIVELVFEGNALPGASFSVYRVGDINEAAELTLRQPFSADFDVSDARDRTGWDQLAREMTDYCHVRGISPDLTGVSNQSGRVSFGTGGDMPSGLYLVVGESVSLQNRKVHFLPFLISLPSWNAETHGMDYSVHASPKLDSETVEPTPSPQPSPTPGPNLPQTGMLWWPVPLLLFVGLFLLSIGFLRRWGGQYGKE